MSTWNIPIVNHEVSELKVTGDMLGDRLSIIAFANFAVLSLGAAEEAYGHEMIRFLPIENSQEPRLSGATDAFSIYASPGLIFLERGRYLLFVLPIGGSGIFDPTQRKFAIAYPLIALDLLKRKFAVVINDDRAFEGVEPGADGVWNLKFKPRLESAQTEAVDPAKLTWYNGLDKVSTEEKFRELYPKIVLDSNPSENEHGVLKGLKSLFGSRRS